MGKKVQKTRELAFVLPNWVRGGMGSALVWSETCVSAHAGSYSRKFRYFNPFPDPGHFRRSRPRRRGTPGAATAAPEVLW